MIKIKAYYIIGFKGFFEHGVFILKLFKKSEEINFNSVYEAGEKATKFKFKWLADFWCRVLNKGEVGIRTYYVQKIEIKK